VTKPILYPVCVVGAGLAGSECVYQLAKRGIEVLWIEMKPKKKSPAHHLDGVAELVCSNSLRSLDVMNAVGLIKHEMTFLDSLVMRAAYKARVPAGSALAVDRELFSATISQVILGFANVTYVSHEVVGFAKKTDLNTFEIFCADHHVFLAEHLIIATGPLTADALAKNILEVTSQNSLYFYDSIAPIVDQHTIDMKKAFFQSRYDKDQSESGDYLNCPMNPEQYDLFLDALLSAELVEVKDFEEARFFEGCLPIEVMAARGRDTLRFGPMKPVGLTNPHHPDERLHAVVQLRQDNAHGTLFNMVGFQTRMRYPEQLRIFRMIPGLETADFVRLGSMHRNTYLCSPKLLQDGLELQSLPNLHFSGQITGCEGYVESAAVGLYVGLFVARRCLAQNALVLPPQTTALGALLHHLLRGDIQNYQPMNINFGLFSDLPEGFHKKDRKTRLVQRAMQDFQMWFYDNASS